MLSFGVVYTILLVCMALGQNRTFREPYDSAYENSTDNISDPLPLYQTTHINPILLYIELGALGVMTLLSIAAIVFHLSHRIKTSRTVIKVVSGCCLLLQWIPLSAEFYLAFNNNGEAHTIKGNFVQFLKIWRLIPMFAFLSESRRMVVLFQTLKASLKELALLLVLIFDGK